MTIVGFIYEIITFILSAESEQVVTLANWKIIAAPRQVCVITHPLFTVERTK